MPELAPETRKSAVRILFITIFLDLLGFGIMIPQIPFFAKMCHAGGSVIGMVGAVYSLLQFAMAPFWGRVSDRIGRRPVILIGLCGAGIAYLVFGASLKLAALTGLSPVPFLIGSRAFAGFFNANIATAQAYMADLSEGNDRAAAMGLVGAAFGMGFVMGPVISAGISTATGSPVLPFYFAALCELGCFLWALRVLPETRVPGEKLAADPISARRLALDLIPAGPLQLTMAAILLSTLGMAGMENTLGLFVMDSPELHFSTNQFAAILLYTGVVIALTQGLAVKKLARRLSESRLLVVGATAMIFGLGLIPLATTTPVIYGLAGLVCFGYGLVSPSLSSLTSKLAPEAVRGELLGIGQSMSALGRIIGPLVAGYLYEKVSHGATYYVAGAFSAVCTVVAIRLDRRVAGSEHA